MSFFSMKRARTVVSKFLEGPNMSTTLDHSKFGKIKRIICRIFGVDKFKEFDMPKVVVIGCESTGKSSLLENLIKCPILPRDNKICTKCPIHIKMSRSDTISFVVKYKDRVYTERRSTVAKRVLKIMGIIKEIVADEITVCISGPDVQTFEFYDLPGIRAYPPDIAQRTIDISTKYITMTDCIVLCVVPATQPRLTASRSIALLQEHNKCEDSILALTMIDRIDMADAEELLINRVSKDSDEFKELSFNSCIGVINRSHRDTESLKSSNIIEEKWIRSVFDPDNVSKKHQEKLSAIISKLGVKNLISQLDALYSMHIHNNWKPRVLADMRTKFNGIYVQIQQLGCYIPQFAVMQLIAEFIHGIPQLNLCDINTNEVTFNTHKINMCDNKRGDHCRMIMQYNDIISNFVNRLLLIKGCLTDGKTQSAHPFNMYICNYKTNLHAITGGTAVHLGMERYSDIVLPILQSIIDYMIECMRTHYRKMHTHQYEGYNTYPVNVVGNIALSNINECIASATLYFSKYELYNRGTLKHDIEHGNQTSDNSVDHYMSSKHIIAFDKTCGVGGTCTRTAHTRMNRIFNNQFRPIASAYEWPLLIPTQFMTINNVQMNKSSTTERISLLNDMELITDKMQELDNAL